MNRKRWWLLFQLALFGVVVWAAWYRLAPELAGVSAADFVRFHPAVGLLLLSTLGLTLLHLVQAFLWRRVVVDVGAPRPDARTTVRVYFLSGYARFIPGNLWQFAGLAALGRQAGIPALASAAGGVIGNVAFLATGAVFLIFTVPGLPGVAQLAGGVLGGAVVLAGVLLLTGTPAGVRLRARLSRRAPQKLLPALELAGRIRPSHALAWMLGYGACWLLLGASFAVFVSAFVPGALVHARALAGTMAFGYVGGYVVLFAPAGIGVRETIMMGLLASVVPGPAAVFIPVAARIWFLVAEALAFATFLVLPRRADRAPDRPDAAAPGPSAEVS